MMHPYDTDEKNLCSPMIQMKTPCICMPVDAGDGQLYPMPIAFLINQYIPIQQQSASPANK
jgi:hypothetical protein